MHKQRMRLRSIFIQICIKLNELFRHYYCRDLVKPINSTFVLFEKMQFLCLGNLYKVPDCRFSSVFRKNNGLNIAVL